MEIQRIIEKLNNLYDKENYAEALRLINYWLEDSKTSGDRRSEFTFLNELMGTYRKMGKQKEAEEAAKAAVSLGSELGILDSPGGAMAFLNEGTVYKTFGKPEDALLCYKKAELVFKKYLEPDDERFAGLYNNMGAVCVDLERYSDASDCLERALSIISNIPGTDREQEIILSNIDFLKQKEPEQDKSGLGICRRYFEIYGLPMLKEQFPELTGKIAAGLVGSGSECFGFDDEISRDHDFEPGFCLWIPGEDEVDSQTAFRLQRAYDALPKEFEGLKKNLLGPVGGKRKGVIRIDEFIKERLGDHPLTMQQWLLTPSYVFAEMLNGEVWMDGSGKLTELRRELCNMPADAWLKRFAGQLFIMNQSGQYNYGRCRQHGEELAARLALSDFVKAAMECIFLLNGKYMPYYKWSFRALKSLPKLSGLSSELESILCTVSSEETEKNIEKICAAICEETAALGIAEAKNCDLERLAYAVNDRIENSDIRNLSVLYAS